MSISFFDHVIPATKADIKHLQKNMSKANEALQAIKEQLAKVRDEILGKIADLEGQIANADLPDDAKATLAELKTTIQSLDDVVPDAPPTP